MIVFPHAKINLGLSIISKRTDGFHNLESVFYPLPVRDILEIVPADSTTLISSGIALPGSSGDNLVIRAYQLLKNHFPQIAATRIYLHKNIPCGAGLGGGSSDAGCMLKLLNEYFGLHISQGGLNAYALELGSDCPFFLQESPCHASGRGEILEPVGLDLSGYSILLVHSGMPVSTSWAYAQIQPAGSTFNIRAIIQEPVKNWRGRLVNDFEIPVFRQYPELEKIKKQLYEAGALYASMTGSGSSFYGIFEKGRIPEAGIPSKARQNFLP